MVRMIGNAAIAVAGSLILLAEFAALAVIVPIAAVIYTGQRLRGKVPTT